MNLNIKDSLDFIDSLNISKFENFKLVDIAIEHEKGNIESLFSNNISSKVEKNLTEEIFEKIHNIEDTINDDPSNFSQYSEVVNTTNSEWHTTKSWFNTDTKNRDKRTTNSFLNATYSSYLSSDITIVPNSCDEPCATTVNSFPSVSETSTLEYFFGENSDYVFSNKEDTFKVSTIYEDNVNVSASTPSYLDNLEMTSKVSVENNLVTKLSTKNLELTTIVLAENLELTTKVSSDEFNFSSQHTRGKINSENGTFSNASKNDSNNLTDTSNVIHSNSSVLIILISVSSIILFLLLTLLYIYFSKKNKNHSKVNLNSNSQPKFLRKPLPPTLLPLETILDNNIECSNDVFPITSSILREEIIISPVALNSVIIKTDQSYDSGIDNLAFNDNEAEDLTLVPNNITKATTSKFKRSVPAYLTKMKRLTLESPLRVLSSDGSLFSPSHSLSSCLVPAPPYESAAVTIHEADDDLEGSSENTKI